MYQKIVQGPYTISDCTTCMLKKTKNKKKICKILNFRNADTDLETWWISVPFLKIGVMLAVCEGYERRWPTPRQHLC